MQKSLFHSAIVLSVVSLFGCGSAEDISNGEVNLGEKPGVAPQVSPASGTRYDTIMAGSVFGYDTIGAFSGNSSSSPYSLTPGSSFADTAIGATSWGTSRIDGFLRGTMGSPAVANQMAHVYTLDGGATHGSDNWGSPTGWSLVGRPGVSSWGTGRVDVFCVAQNNSTAVKELWHRSWDNGYFRAWESFGKPSSATLSSGAGAVSWGASRIDVFVKTTSGDMWHAVTTSGAPQGYWDNWSHPSGVTLNDNPAVVSLGVNDMQMVTLSTDGHIRHAAWNSSTSFNIVWDDWGYYLPAPNDFRYQLGAAAINSHQIVVSAVQNGPGCTAGDSSCLSNSNNLDHVMQRIFDQTTLTLSWHDDGAVPVQDPNGHATGGVAMTAW